MAGNEPDRESERVGNWVWCDDKNKTARTRKSWQNKKWPEINLIFIECKFTELNVAIPSYFCSVFRFESFKNQSDLSHVLLWQFCNPNQKWNFMAEILCSCHYTIGVRKFLSWPTVSQEVIVLIITENGCTHSCQPQNSPYVRSTFCRRQLTGKKSDQIGGRICLDVTQTLKQMQVSVRRDGILISTRSWRITVRDILKWSICRDNKTDVSRCSRTMEISCAHLQ